MFGCLQKHLLTILLSACTLMVSGQAVYSITTDLSLMRNFSPQQKFWAIGQTVIAEVHVNNKETAYAWISYFSPGKFSNSFTATAHSPFTNPSSIPYKVKGRWLNREVSIGWKHYLRGSSDEPYLWNLYSRIGFGLMIAEASNVFVPAIDTSLYRPSPTPVEGTHSFKRLTLDLGLGYEHPLGGGFFVYGEARTWIPASGFPSPVLHKNKNVPLPLIVGVGLRIMFSGY